MEKNIKLPESKDKRKEKFAAKVWKIFNGQGRGNRAEGAKRKSSGFY